MKHPKHIGEFACCIRRAYTPPPVPPKHIGEFACAAAFDRKRCA